MWRSYYVDADTESTILFQIQAEDTVSVPAKYCRKTLSSYKRAS